MNKTTITLNFETFQNQIKTVEFLTVADAIAFGEGYRAECAYFGFEIWFHDFQGKLHYL